MDFVHAVCATRFCCQGYVRGKRRRDEGPVKVGFGLYQLSIFASSDERFREISRTVADVFTAQPLYRRDLSAIEFSDYVVFDINLEDGTYVADLRRWLSRRLPQAKVIFVVDPAVRHQIVRAYALGATNIVERPVARDTLLKIFFGGSITFANPDSELVNDRSQAVEVGIAALQRSFAAVVSGTPVDLRAVDAAGDFVVANIEEEGIARWINRVRSHHSQTYQHCLLVTGVVTAFSQYLGFSRRDRQKLALGGLLHDIGKAAVPLALLEKPGPLDRQEAAELREHPALGFAALQGVQRLDPAILDVVIHHHEYLDGSGYPHGLNAGQLSDLVHLSTIGDVFGALIERRPYKRPLSGPAAYQILVDMGPKLDADLVLAFRPFAYAQFQ